MSLKQSIVIVSEFTFKMKSGAGSRGSTPGAYAYDYMARGDAVEALTPVKLHEGDTLDTRYQARDEAVRSAADIEELKTAFRESQQSAGVAFGYGSVSLSHDKLVAACDDIQDQFDNGKTVFKTVLSFEEDYLKQLGVVQEDFSHFKKGDYRGQIDQMKLRLAVMSGLDRLSERGFDDLQYVGAFQVDTHHVHCHLAMVDRGDGRIINSKTGAQKGKLSKEDFEVVRQGVDMYLEQHAMVRHMSPSVYNDERNVRCYVKNYTHEMMRERALPQFLVACLPEDRSLWRAGSSSPAMRKPNALVREYVNNILAQPNSGYDAALTRVKDELDYQYERGMLTVEDYKKRYRSGRNGIVEDCMNGVYQALRQVPDDELRVKTQTLSRMSMDFESMAALNASSDFDKMTEFGFRLRSYSSRQDFHRKESVKYHEAVNSYKSQENIAPEAVAVINFMAFEEEYNAMLLSKYQHLMLFLPGEDEYDDELEELRQQRERMTRYNQMLQDEKLRRMSGEAAEQYGRERYGMNGGSVIVAAPQTAEIRAQRMRDAFNKTGSELDFKLGLKGLGLFEDSDTGEISVRKAIRHDFNTVKALDLHHLDLDFGHDIPVSKANAEKFFNIAQRRIDLFNAAAKYLTDSGQADQISALPVNDIRKMARTADSLQRSGKLSSAVAKYASMTETVRNERTMSLDLDYNDIMARAVRERVNSQADRGDI